MYVDFYCYAKQIAILFMSHTEFAESRVTGAAKRDVRRHAGVARLQVVTAESTGGHALRRAA